jgi:7-dehydrocholesterol reductase
MKRFEPTIIYDNWGALLIVANIIGYGLAIFAYIKAKYFPSHPDDVKFSGDFVYDFFMGAEFNPRIGNFDFKLFWNGRPGIGAWNLINISFMFAQMRIWKLEYPTNSIMLVTFLHFLYIVDFFYNEDWYLRTIDICHDHYGWYLGWGDPVWLPWMYTLQGLFLVTHPVDLPWWQFGAVLATGLLGYYIFRMTNNQKDIVRKANGNVNIWGKPATFIRAAYKTSDGKVHESLLLTSGFWGLARHFNYLGDLTISFAYCAACGFGYFLPYFYFFYMAILLGFREGRDDYRCRLKYGKKWEEYCDAVKYRIIPYVY